MNDTALSPQKPKLFQLRAFSGKPKDKRLNLRRRKSETDFLTPDQTYYDVEALESLLEERERDLELAARIGQTLLEKNRELVEQISELEGCLGNAQEENIQLKHSIQLKDDLIKGYGTETDPYSGESTPSVSGKVFRGGYTVQEHVNQLEERIVRLQKENSELRSEISDAVEKLQTKEDEYHEMVNGSVNDLNSVSKRLSFLRKELTTKTSECFEQQEQITRLLAQLVDLQREKKEKVIEAEENLNAFEESQQTQTFLVAEFHELEKKYLETVRMLEETQASGDLCRTFESQASNLANEIADIASPLSNMGKLPHNIRTRQFLTVENSGQKNESGFVDSGDNTLNTLTHLSANLAPEGENLNNSLSEVHCGIPLGHFGDPIPSRIVPDPISTPPNPPIDSGLISPVLSMGRSPCGTSVFSSGLNTPLIGKSGVPGSRDLERALNRLAIRRKVENQLTEQRKSKAQNYKEKIKKSEYNDASVPRKPEKLRIIKPMGTPVMQQWRQLTQVDLDTAVSQELSLYPDYKIL